VINRLPNCRLDDLPVLSGTAGNRAGAAFVLPAKPAANARWTRPDGWAVAISECSRYVVASGGRDRDYPSAWRTAYAATQEALDVWSARGVADFETEQPYGNHVAFWDDTDGAIVRVVGRSMLNVTMSATGVVRDAKGNVKLQPAPAQDWHQSMRFFRQSQLTDDLFDSLRSVWLAVENLLDSLEPYQMGADREEGWLKRALQTAATKLDLTRYLPPARASGQQAKLAHNAAYAYFYDELRTHLFHAKATRQPTLPHDPTGMRALVERHERLTRFYLDLLGAVTGVVRPSGAMTISGFDAMTAGLEVDAEILVTDDETKFDETATEPAPAGGQVLAAPATRGGAMESPGVKVFIGRIAGVDVDALAAITRWMFRSSAVLISGHTPEGVVELRGIDWLDVQMEFGLGNPGLPKTFAAA
jgi:hypothetical protein